MKLLKQALIFLLKKIEEFIFPKCCIMCGKLGKNTWCKECKHFLLTQAIYIVENKIKKGFYFNKHIYIFLYQGKIRNLILDYKFNDKSYLHEIFVKIIIKNKKICGILEKYDIIIPVPIHKKRKSDRGYNQSELIASKICNYVKNIQYENKMIIKAKNTMPQSLLTKEQRKQNTQNVYKLINKEKIENKKIILFDDVYTTGSTVNEISKLLKENGAKEIIVLTIAKD